MIIYNQCSHIKQSLEACHVQLLQLSQMNSGNQLTGRWHQQILNLTVLLVLRKVFLSVDGCLLTVADAFCCLAGG